MTSLPKSTQAAILVEQHRPLVLDEIELPSELRHGQVLVEIHYSGICGAQLGEIEGVKGPDPHLPHLLGHEGSGRVLEVGPGVTSVRAGDHVVLHWRKGRGIEAETPVYRWRGARLNAGWVTTFNEHAVVSENRVTAIPADFDLELAALLGCAVTTAFGVVGNNARLRAGESIVVFGAGGVGLSVIQAAALTGAYPIVAVDVVAEKLAKARELGATHTVDSRRADTRTEVLAIAGREGADVVVESTGLPGVIQLAYELAAADGRTVLVGVPRKGQNISIYSLPLHFGKVLTGSHGGDARPERDIPRCVRLHGAGRLRLSDLITDRLPLSEVNGALDRMRQGSLTGRAVMGIVPRA